MIKSRNTVIPVIFPDKLVHESIANLILENLRTEHNDPAAEIYSAGNVSIDVMSSWHGSETLKMPHSAQRQLLDFKLMETYDYCHGILP